VARVEEEDREDTSGQAMHMEGVYIISVAARLLDVHPQTLRKYERLGLIRPGRTIGMLRLYSRDDIRKVRLIQHLSGNLGLNLAGVEFALGMIDNLLTLRQRLADTTEGTQVEQAVDQEFADLFRSMSLPLEE
jgi:MerR family transcriptional regulator/heat shock protein HspR